MTTGNVNYVRHTFKELKAKKVYSVYELEEVDGSNQLTNLIRIEEFRGYSNAKNLTDYLRIRNTCNWSKCKKITGLFITNLTNVFYGDYLHYGFKSLIIFQFSKDRKYLIIDYFKGYYPSNRSDLGTLINKHQYKL